MPPEKTPTIIETDFSDLVQIIPQSFPDERGFFFESFRIDWMSSLKKEVTFTQDNQSFSKKNVIRGLHFQRPPFAQAKLVRVVQGSVLDVVVDLRKNEPTFGRVFSLILDSKKNNQLYVPEGFAHGFAAMEDSIVCYKCSSIYHRPSESGIVWSDSDLKINWTIQDPIVSEKDKQLSTFKELIKKSVI